MAVISSPIFGISSFMERHSLQNQSVGKRVSVQLPTNVKQVLQDFSSGQNKKLYQELLYVLNNEELQDDELIRLLKEVQECIPLLDKTLQHFVEALLKVSWVYRKHKVIKEYQGFVLDLVSAHNYYTKLILDKLMTVFKTASSEDEWADGVIPEEEQHAFNRAHDLLKVLLEVVPMSSDIMLKAVPKCFPYYKQSPHVQECYIYNILRIIQYQPHSRKDILFDIFQKLVIMDVNAPRNEVLDKEGEDEDMEVDVMFDMDHCEDTNGPTSVQFKMKHPVANNLDIAMKQMFLYIKSECVENYDTVNWGRTKKLYEDLIRVFDEVVLTTNATYYVQFLMFYMCSFKVVLIEAFLLFLWRKVINPNVPSVIRQSAVMYIGSLLSRAKYVDIRMLRTSISEMSTWIHKYITSQDGLECVNSDVRVHAVFYSVCQSLFYVIAFRHRDLVGSRKNLTFLQSLNLTKIITSKLNPLKVCLSVVVQNFAAVTRTYQLAYCYSVIEHNSRYTLPVIHQDKKGYYYSKDSGWLDDFFPYDPFILKRCAQFIEPLYSVYQKAEQEIQVSPLKRDEPLEEAEEDEDDFLCDVATISEKFSYSSSPGFKRL